MYRRPSERSRRKCVLHLPLMAILLCTFQISALADPVAARTPEGTIHGYLTLRTQEGHVLAAGGLLQVVRGNRVTSRMVFHFKDGSLDDEKAVFSQRGDFRLISDDHIQKGPFFPHPMDLSIDVRSGEVTAKSPGKDGKEDVKIERMKLPADLSNGMILPITKNLPPGASAEVSMVVATPEPRLAKLAISPEGEETFSLAGFERKALHYEIKIKLEGIAGVVVPLIGKEPPVVQVWIESGEVPEFIGEEGPIAQYSAIVSIEQTGPALPGAALASESRTGAGN